MSEIDSMTSIEKVGDVVDEKTEGKYESMVDKAQDAAKKFSQD